MNYNEEWRSVEEKYDLQNPFSVAKTVRSSLSGLTLHDVLIIRNWIDYARGIGDSSIRLLDQDTVSYPPIYNNAQARWRRTHGRVQMSRSYGSVLQPVLSHCVRPIPNPDQIPLRMQYSPQRLIDDFGAWAGLNLRPSRYDLLGP